jgi:hypothetical protein
MALHDPDPPVHAGGFLLARGACTLAVATGHLQIQKGRSFLKKFSISI